MSIDKVRKNYYIFYYMTTYYFFILNINRKRRITTEKHLSIYITDIVILLFLMIFDLIKTCFICLKYYFNINKKMDNYFFHII